MGRVDFKLDDKELRTNVAEFGPKVNKFLTVTTDFAKGKGVDQMKLKAPWTDRTGQARASLNGSTAHEGSGPLGFTRHTITFAHGKDYGIWLEIANSGRFQIIMPTVVAIGKACMSVIGDMLDTLDHPAASQLRPNVQLPYVGKQGTSQGTKTRTEKQARRAKRTAKGQTSGTTPHTRRS
jgi:hypothetical protein